VAGLCHLFLEGLPPKIFISKLMDSRGVMDCITARMMFFVGMLGGEKKLLETESGSGGARGGITLKRICL
jgi:hypothetical protein